MSRDTWKKGEWGQGREKEGESKVGEGLARQEGKEMGVTPLLSE